MFTNLLSPFSILLLTPIFLLLSYLLPYYLTRPALRPIPGPFLARFSSLWLLVQARRGRRYLAVDEAHRRYGPVVRIQPGHVSVAAPEAVGVVYGHRNGLLKSDYYDAFVSIRRGLFNTRDRAEHSRKRKTISHTFSAKSIGAFEAYIHDNLDELKKQWDRRANEAAAAAAAATKEGAKDDGHYAMDALHWFNYLAFDIIGDLAFGAPFGMLKAGKDVAEVRHSTEAEVDYVSAIEVLNRRGEVSGTLGCYPQLKPYAAYLPDPFFRNGLAAVKNLAGIAIARVGARLEKPSERVDLLARLMEGRDESGEPLGREELTAEALTQLIAGSDTTSNTSCALLYHCLVTPDIIPKLQAELDTALPNADALPTYPQVKDLPYLNAVIQETLRIHSTSSLGLPRIIPPNAQPLTLSLPNRAPLIFSPGTVLSVPSYTLHHSTAIWGPNAADFDPSRWLPSPTGESSPLTETQKSAFIPFSYGPRACVGRNVAEMELALIVATVFRRYEFELRQEGLETREGFLRKPLELQVGMRLRR